MSELDLAAIRARADAATPAPWKLWGMSVLADPVGDSNLDTAIHVANTSYRNAQGHPRTNDADFIAHARSDVPALLAEVARLRAIIGSAVTELDSAGDAYCSPNCQGEPACMGCRTLAILRGEALS